MKKYLILLIALASLAATPQSTLPPGPPYIDPTAGLTPAQRQELIDALSLGAGINQALASIIIVPDAAAYFQGRADGILAARQIVCDGLAAWQLPTPSTVRPPTATADKASIAYRRAQVR
jgi:hypothetical protein